MPVSARGMVKSLYIHRCSARIRILSIYFVYVWAWQTKICLARRENVVQTTQHGYINTDAYSRVARLRECGNPSRKVLPGDCSYSAPHQLNMGFSNDAASLARAPPEQMASPECSSDHSVSPRKQHISTRPPTVRGTPVISGAILQLSGVSTSACRRRPYDAACA